MLSTRLLVAIAGMEFADVLSQAFQLGLSQLVAAGRPEEGGEGFLQDHVISDISRNFSALDGCFVHEGELVVAFKTEKICQTLENFHVAGGRIDAALHFAPVTRIEAGLFAKIAEGKAFLETEFFDGIAEHIKSRIVLW
jgi:hypothetical protein